MTFYSIVCLVLISSVLSKNFGENQEDGNSANGLYFGKLHEQYAEDGELAELFIQTKVLNHSDLSIHDYHILKLQIVSKQEPITIHLLKNNDLASENVIIEQTEELALDCHYTGEIVSPPYGAVALSACVYRQGFTGHMILGDEHFVLEPVSNEDGNVNHVESHNENNPTDQTNNKANSTESINPGSLFGTENENLTNTPILHRVYRSTVILKKENITKSDALNIPKDELHKALEQMDNTTYGDSYPDEADNDTDIDSGNSTDVSNDNATEIDLTPLYFGTESNEDGSSVVETFAAPKKSTQTGKSNKPNKSKPKQKQNHKILELGVFLDPEFVNIWQKRFPKNTKAYMQAYVLGVVNNMNLLYSQPSIGDKIVFHLVYLEYLTSWPSDLQNHHGDSIEYISSFCKFQGNKNTNGNQWDHAIVLTGLDLHDKLNPAIIGMAFMGAMCLKDWSCSIMEGKSFATSIVLAHEIGHSLGITHDGEKMNTECDSNKYIMSPTTGEGKISWSSCSAKNLRDYFNKGQPEITELGFYASHPPVCLLRASALSKKKIKYSNGKLPGASYGAKTQCILEVGEGAIPITKNNEDICQILKCETHKPMGLLTQVTTTPIHPALEGTSCADGKHCRYGKCIAIGNSG